MVAIPPAAPSSSFDPAPAHGSAAHAHGPTAAAPDGRHERAHWSHHGAWFVAGVGVALATQWSWQHGWLDRSTRSADVQDAAVASAVNTSLAGAARQATATPEGKDDDGAPLAPHDWRVKDNPGPLGLRNSCAWGVPGRNPYRGTVQQALEAAQLPPEVVRSITDMARRGWVYDEVTISRAGIQTVEGRQQFPARLKAMAFGNSLCLDTRVNFPAGHEEHGVVYKATDGRARTHLVVVPDVCQNVSVLGARGTVDDGRHVPEPGTLLLTLAGGVAGLAAHRAVRSTRARTRRRRSKASQFGRIKQNATRLAFFRQDLLRFRPEAARIASRVLTLDPVPNVPPVGARRRTARTGPHARPCSSGPVPRRRCCSHACSRVRCLPRLPPASGRHRPRAPLGPPSGPPHRHRERTRCSTPPANPGPQGVPGPEPCRCGWSA